MGQYWKAVNLDKRQFISPWALGSGAKLWEQLANPGPGQALIILLAAMPQPRGGGDLKADPVIGSWAGDRVVLVGDYAEDDDLPSSPIPFSEIYGLTNEDRSPRSPRSTDILGMTHAGLAEDTACQSDVKSTTVPNNTMLTCMMCIVNQARADGFEDITPAVARVIERELNGKFTDGAWKDNPQ